MRDLSFGFGTAARAAALALAAAGWMGAVVPAPAQADDYPPCTRARQDSCLETHATMRSERPNRNYPQSTAVPDDSNQNGAPNSYNTRDQNTTPDQDMAPNQSMPSR